MDTSKIDRVIDAFRVAMYNEYGVSEEGMVANAAGQSGGFSSSAAAKGPVAGFDTVMGTERGPRPQGLKLDGRTKGMKKFLASLQKNRDKRKERKEKKAALSYNPYFAP